MRFCTSCRARAGRASIGGVDVARITRAGIARHIGWVDDVTHVFATSLGDNLRIADTEATEASCVAALAAVGLAAWLASLPEGLSTRLGVGGRPMSAGERQRLGLARALLAGGDTLALDEPTAHIDPTSSADVLDELVGATGSKTVLVISHEPGLGPSRRRDRHPRGRARSSTARRPGAIQLPAVPPVRPVLSSDY